MMARLNIEVVRQAINELTAQGIKPTNPNIVKHIGYGSYSTLTILRKEYPDVFGVSQKRTNTSNTVHNMVHNTVTDSMIHSVWQRIEPRIDDKIQTVFNTQYSTDKRQSHLESKIKALESENEELKVRLDNKEDDSVARINDLEKERLELQGEVLDLRDTVDSLKSENEGIKRTHAKDRENIKGEQDKLVQSLKSKNSKLQLQVEQLQAQLLEQNSHADLESKLEAIQKEAQANIDSLTQKLGEANQEIARQSTEYNKLHEKYTALKTDVADGNAPSTKSTKRKPLTLDSDAQKTSVNDITFEVDGQQIVVPDGQVPENREVFIEAIQQIASLLGRVDTVKLLNDNEVKTFRGKKFSNDILRKPPFNC